MIGETRAWYSEYSGYLDFVMLSVKIVDPMNSVVSRNAPATVHCRSEPAAITPKKNSAHHCACSKKKLGCRLNCQRPD